MKKTMKLTAAVVLVALLLTSAWAIGRREGIRHAVEDSHVWMLENGNICIELDGEWNTHSCDGDK